MKNYNKMIESIENDAEYYNEILQNAIKENKQKASLKNLITNIDTKIYRNNVSNKNKPYEILFYRTRIEGYRYKIRPIYIGYKTKHDAINGIKKYKDIQRKQFEQIINYMDEHNIKNNYVIIDDKLKYIKNYFHKKNIILSTGLFGYGLTKSNIENYIENHEQNKII